VTFDLGPVTFDPEIPFRSVSPERMLISKFKRHH
jgi:hypothetical protein